MNEYANFISGEISAGQPCKDDGSAEFKNKVLDDLPFDPSGSVQALNITLGYRTVSLDALHYSKDDAKFIASKEPLLEYDFHNLNGFLEGVATHSALTKLSPLVFSLSRSTFPGAGRYMAHWTGDNYASWDDLKFSISEIFNFQMFGIPFVRDESLI